MTTETVRKRALLTLPEAAQILGIPYTTCHKEVRAHNTIAGGKIPVEIVSLPNARVRYRVRCIDVEAVTGVAA
jgi:hypothetical protein